MADFEQQTALERRRLALEKLDNAKFSFYHVRYVRFALNSDFYRAILVAGVGLYSPIQIVLTSTASLMHTISSL
jgi:hypothetical protein